MQPTEPKIKTVALVATKLKRYAGKALRAGDPFQARPQDAKMLTAAKLADYDTRDQARAPAEQRHVPTASADELAALRGDYEVLAGRKAHNLWKADRLRAEIEKIRAERDAQAAGAVDEGSSST